MYFEFSCHTDSTTIHFYKNFLNIIILPQITQIRKLIKIIINKKSCLYNVKFYKAK